MTPTIHPGAARDLSDAFDFYRHEAGLGVARRFLAAFERVVQVLMDYPDLGTPTGEDRRAYPLAGFPYSVIYRRTATEITVLVVRHHSRDPTHGAGRR